jgi:hypothetical protein
MAPNDGSTTSSIKGVDQVTTEEGAERTSVMTMHVYRIAADGTTVVLGDYEVRNGEPYTRPLAMEYPPCRCLPCRRASEEDLPRHS